MKSLALLVLLASSAVALDTKEMTSWETGLWATIKSDAAASASFQTTRDYYRWCQRIVDGKSPAKDLTGLPKKFNKKYLAKGESKIINKAVEMNMNSYIEKKIETDPEFRKNAPAMIDGLEKVKKKTP